MTNCTTCAVAQGYKPAEALQQIGEPVEALRIAACLRQSVEKTHVAFATLTEASRLVESQHARIAELEAELAALRATPPAPAVGEPFGYVNTYTGQFFKDVEPCRKTNEGHWRTVYSAPQAQDVQDAALLDWLSKQYIGPDFRWGDPATEVVVIEMPKGCSYCGDFKTDMRAAIAASAKGV